MQSFYELCIALKEMRDKGLYKALGYREFDLYCKSELGTSDRQIYKYIAIAENLPEDLVNSNSLIGVSKLYLLTTADEEARAEIVQNTNLTETTVRELKAQITALQSAKESAEADAAQARDAVQEKAEQIKSLNAKISEQAEQIDELENRPVEVAVPEPSREVQNMQDAMRRINLEHEEWSAKMQDDHIKQVQEIHAKHRAETDALRAEYEEKLAAAQAAPTEAPDSKEVFKVYLAAVIDAAKRMMAFLSAHPDAACRAQAEKAFQTMLQEVNNEQAV